MFAISIMVSMLGYVWGNENGGVHFFSTIFFFNRPSQVISILGSPLVSRLPLPSVVWSASYSLVVLRMLLVASGCVSDELVACPTLCPTI